MEEEIAKNAAFCRKPIFYDMIAPLTPALPHGGRGRIAMPR